MNVNSRSNLSFGLCYRILTDPGEARSCLNETAKELNKKHKNIDCYVQSPIRTKSKEEEVFLITGQDKKDKDLLLELRLSAYSKFYNRTNRISHDLDDGIRWAIVDHFENKAQTIDLRRQHTGISEDLPK